MGGLAVLLLLALYVAAAGFVVRLAWRRLGALLGAAALLVVITLPFADALAGRALLKTKCERDTQVTPVRVVPNVEGIYTKGRPFKDSPTYYGYKYVEGSRSSGGPVDRAEDGGVAWDVQPRAQFELWEGSREDSYWFYSYRYAVRVQNTREELASVTWHTFRGGWPERILMGLSDAGPGTVAECGDPSAKKRKLLELLHRTLQPARGS